MQMFPSQPPPPHNLHTGVGGPGDRQAGRKSHVHSHPKWGSLSKLQEMAN